MLLFQSFTGQHVALSKTVAVQYILPVPVCHCSGGWQVYSVCRGKGKVRYLCMLLPSLRKPELQHRSAAWGRVLHPEVLLTSCLLSAAAAAENPETQRLWFHVSKAAHRLQYQTWTQQVKKNINHILFQTQSLMVKCYYYTDVTLSDLRTGWVTMLKADTSQQVINAGQTPLKISLF